MKKRFVIFLLIMSIVSSVSASTCLAEESGDSIGIEEMIENLDTTELDELLSELSDEQRSVFGYGSIKDKLKSLTDGDDGMNFGGFVNYVISVFCDKFNNFIPFIASVLAVCILFSLLNSIKGKFASQSTSAIVRLACISLVMLIVFSQIVNLVAESRNFIQFLKEQMDVVFPILLTLMTAIGPSKSAAVYQPTIAILGSAVTNVITIFALPCFLLSIVFHVVGNLSEGITLKNMADFFSGAMKWVLGTAFFLFLGVLSVQGVTASIYDNIYIRTTKLALSKHIPIIGGYLSEGYNLVISGSVLIKNGIGLSGIILLFLSAIPLVAQIVIFSLALRFIAAVVEPIGCKEICDVLCGISKSVTTLIAIICGFVFLYFVFLLLIVCTGNLVI